MDVTDAIENRRSIRDYNDIPVEWNKLMAILDAGRMAPSAGNLQDWKFIVVVDDEKRKELADACAQQVWMEQAPIHIVMVGLHDRNERYYGERGKSIYTIQDSAMAAMNIMLAAQKEGLGTCFVGAVDESILRRVLKIPDTCTPYGVITVGYPDETADIPSKLTLWDVVYFEDWDNKYNDLAEMSGDYSRLISRELSEAKGFVKRTHLAIKEKLKREHPDAVKEGEKEAKEEKLEK